MKYSISLITIECDKLRWNIVVAWPRVWWRSPLRWRKTSLSTKHTPSLSIVPRKGIVATLHISIFLGIAQWSRSDLNLRKSLKSRIYFWIFYVFVFAYIISTIIILKIDWLISCRTGSMLICGIFIIHIQCLRFDTILLMHLCIDLILILHKM